MTFKEWASARKRRARPWPKVHEFTPIVYPSTGAPRSLGVFFFSRIRRVRTCVFKGRRGRHGIRTFLAKFVFSIYTQHLQATQFSYVVSTYGKVNRRGQVARLIKCLNSKCGQSFTKYRLLKRIKWIIIT